MIVLRDILCGVLVLALMCGSAVLVSGLIASGWLWQVALVLVVCWAIGRANRWRDGQ